MRFLDDPDIDIVCELIGGVHPAHEFVQRALQNGKQIVTANKEMIAKKGFELMEEAARRDLDFQFEGSVAGGIPIIQPMKNALAGNRIEEVLGIINGTTNYILTKMAREHADFDDVLKEAQAHGYAEADPTSDIMGYDAQYKIAILAGIAFSSRVNIEDVYVEGITGIGRSDIAYAEEMGYVIKLVGVAKRADGDANGSIQVRVQPALLPKTHPLAATSDVYNAIMVKGDSVGDVMFYGRGAGSGPTGSAVVGDILDVCRNLRANATGRVGPACFEGPPRRADGRRGHAALYPHGGAGSAQGLVGHIGRVRGLWHQHRKHGAEGHRGQPDAHRLGDARSARPQCQAGPEADRRPPRCRRNLQLAPRGRVTHKPLLLCRLTRHRLCTPVRARPRHHPWA